MILRNSNTYIYSRYNFVKVRNLGQNKIIEVKYYLKHYSWSNYQKSTVSRNKKYALKLIVLVFFNHGKAVNYLH